MKTLLTMAFAFIGFTCYAQDIITDKSGQEYWVKILSETAKDITVRLDTGKEMQYKKEWLSSYAYALGSKPEKKNNTIVITTTDDFTIAVRKMVNIISDAGFGIQTIDKDLGILTTTEKAFKGGVTSLTIQVRENSPTEIIIRGSVDGMDLTLYGVTIDGKRMVEFRGMNGSPLMLAWEEMDKVAKAYPEAQITYSTK